MDQNNPNVSDQEYEMTVRLAAMIFVLGFIPVSCSRSTSGIQVRQDVEGSMPKDAVDAQVVAPAAASVASSWDEPRMRALLCGTRRKCRIERLVRLQASGAAVVDVRVDPDVPDPEDQAFAEQWIVSTARTGMKVQLLVRTAALVDERTPLPVHWDIIGNVLRYKYDGSSVAPSAWTGSYEATIDLLQLNIISQSHRYYNRTTACPNETGVWDWDAFHGTVRWSGDGCGGGCRAHEYTSVPQVWMDDEAIVDGDTWQKVVLGSCATRLGRRDTDGAVEAAVADLAVVSVGRALLINIDDPGVSDASRGRLEIWTTDTISDYMGGCASWSDVNDWIVEFPGGNVRGPTVGGFKLDSTLSGRQLKVRMRFGAANIRGLAVRYSGPGGHIATSAFVRGDVSSLGKLRRIDPKTAKCVMDGDHLNAVRIPPVPGEPLYSPSSE